MIVVLAAGVLMSLAGGSVLPALEELPFLDGQWAAGFEKRYEEALPLRPVAVAVWDLLRYSVFRQAAEGALVGEGEWLFTTEEFRAPETEAASLEEQLDFIQEVQRTLENRGVGMVVVVVPAKARVYSDKLGRYAVPAEFRKRYAAVQQGLRIHGIPAPDLLTPLSEARSGEPVFLRTDTHWTPYGARIAAEALAPAVSEVLERAQSPRIAFSAVPEDITEHYGDLVNFIRLGSWLKRCGPAPDVVRPFAAVQPQGSGLGLFDDISIPVVLLGTSYSAGSLWGFDSALKAALQSDVLNVAEEGRGPFEPMRKLLESDVLADVRADVVIWEIPERYFLLPR
jgi:alginate O-acetyltransferase complex protein AlgJ